MFDLKKIDPNTIDTRLVANLRIEDVLLYHWQGRYYREFRAPFRAKLQQYAFFPTLEERWLAEEPYWLPLYGYFINLPRECSQSLWFRDNRWAQPARRYSYLQSSRTQSYYMYAFGLHILAMFAHYYSLLQIPFGELEFTFIDLWFANLDVYAQLLHLLGITTKATGEDLLHGLSSLEIRNYFLSLMAAQVQSLEPYREFCGRWALARGTPDSRWPEVHFLWQLAEKVSTLPLPAVITLYYEVELATFPNPEIEAAALALHNERFLATIAGKRPFVLLTTGGEGEPEFKPTLAWTLPSFILARLAKSSRSSPNLSLLF